MPATWRFDHGATTHPGQVVAFRLWAPWVQQVEVVVGGAEARPVRLDRTPGGFHEAVVLGVARGATYTFALDGRLERPDPCSREQAAGPLGPSRVVEGLHDRWMAPGRLLVSQGLRPTRIHEAVVDPGPETSPAGYAGAVPADGRPGEAVRLESVTEASARTGGPAALFAASRSAGGARGLHAFVAASHLAGLAVILRLPFEHLSEESRFLLDFGPWVESRPLGDGVRLDLQVPQVRSLAVDVMLGWLAEYGVDVLELPAPGGWRGLGRLVDELAARTRALGLAELPLRLLGEGPERSPRPRPTTEPSPRRETSP